MTVKKRRRCKYCKEWNYLTPSKFKRWGGYCDSHCKNKAKHANPKWLRKQCDALFSKLIREKGFCEKCGNTDYKLDCAHVIPRGNKTLRFDPMNALSLCHRCHRFWAHSNPLEFTAWYKEKYPSRYVYLMEYKNIFTKRTVSDYQELLKNLQEKNIKGLLIDKELK